MEMRRGVGGSVVTRPSFERACLVLAALLVLAACARDPKPGSRADLSARLNDLNPPVTMRQLNETYVDDCEAHSPACPGLTRWFALEGAIKPSSDAYVADLKAMGYEPDSAATEPNIIHFGDSDYMYFVVFGGGARYLNDSVPSNVEVELIVSLLQTEDA